MVVTFYIPITPLSGHTSLRWFGLSACTASPEGQPPSLAQHGSCWRSTPSPSLPFQDTLQGQVVRDNGQKTLRTVSTWIDSSDRTAVLRDGEHAEMKTDIAACPVRVSPVVHAEAGEVLVAATGSEHVLGWSAGAGALAYARHRDGAVETTGLRGTAPLQFL